MKGESMDQSDLQQYKLTKLKNNTILYGLLPLISSILFFLFLFIDSKVGHFADNWIGRYTGILCYLIVQISPIVYTIFLIKLLKENTYRKRFLYLMLLPLSYAPITFLLLFSFFDQGW